MKCYLIGIKGSGMAGLALLLKSDNYEVCGKDVDRYLKNEDKLKEAKIDILPFEDRSYLEVDLVIIGHDFYHQDLIEELVKAQVPFFEYHRFLNFYIQSDRLISVAGSHGKTTTVKLLITALKEEVSFLEGDGKGNHDDQERYFVLESCEYKDHFLAYHPRYAIITNVEYDHVDYFKNQQQYDDSFLKFIAQSQKAIVDYEFVEKYDLKNAISYGLNEKATYHYLDYKLEKNFISGTIAKDHQILISFKLPLVGEQFLHHLLVIAAFFDLENLDLEQGFKNLCHFKNAERRFDIEEHDQYVLIDDYAHHPQQIEENLKNVIRCYPNYRHYAIFKPDRKSRFEYFFDEFQKILSEYDHAYVLPLPDNQENKGTDVSRIANEKITFLETPNALKDKHHFKAKSTYSLMSSKSLSEISKIIKQIDFKEK